MSTDFILKWFLSLIIGSFWVVVSSTVAEKVSGRIGGLLVGLPSTAVISLMFIGLTQGVPAAQTASTIIPFSSGFYCYSFVTYLLLSKHKDFKTTLFGTLAVWFTFSYLISYANPSLFLSMTVWLAMVMIAIYWVVKYVKIDKKVSRMKVKGSSLWFKAFVTGFVISLVVLISKLAGPKWGGIFATFPALTISTLLVTIKSGGLEFTRLIMKNVLISTTSMIGLFAIFSYYLYPFLGVVWGTVVSYVLLLLIGVPLYGLMFKGQED